MSRALALDPLAAPTWAALGRLYAEQASDGPLAAQVSLHCEGVGGGVPVLGMMVSRLSWGGPMGASHPCATWRVQSGRRDA